MPVILQARTTGTVAPTENFNVRLYTEHDTTEAGDYLPLNETLTFRATDFVLENGRYVRTLSTTLEIIDDPNEDKIEVFRLKMDVDALPEHVQVPAYPTAPPGAWLIDITDNDDSIVGFTITKMEVEEGEELAVMVAVDTVVEYPFTMVFTSGDGTAQHTSDYTSVSTIIDFAAFQREKTFRIQTADDTLDEEDETFHLYLVDNGLDASMHISPTQALVTILDDEGKPGQPRSLSAGEGNTRATLQWTPPDGAGIGRIMRHEYQRWWPNRGEWEEIPDSAEGEANASSYTITGLTNHEMHQFRLRAVNENGASSLVSTSAVPYAGAPSAPRNFTAETHSSRHIRLSWTEPTAGSSVTITGYHLERSNDGVTPNSGGSQLAPGLSEIILGTSSKPVTRCYRIRTFFKSDTDPYIVQGDGTHEVFEDAGYGISAYSPWMCASTTGEQGAVPLLVAVYPAWATEGGDDTIDFQVSMSRTANSLVRVLYLTQDATAKAGQH